MPRSDPKIIPWNWIIPAAIIAALFVAWFFLPVKDWLETFRQWIEGLGFWGGVVFVVAYVIATLMLAPGVLLTLAAGLVFGLAWGFPIVMIGAMLGASLAFLGARCFLRERIKRALHKRPKFKAVDEAVSEDGWKIVLLLRLDPFVPFSLQNYFFGITEIKFWQYVAATFFGIIPGVVVHLYVGAIGGALTGKTGTEWGTSQWSFFGIGLVATIAIAVVVMRKAKKKLEEAGVSGGAKSGSHRRKRKELARS